MKSRSKQVSRSGKSKAEAPLLHSPATHPSPASASAPIKIKSILVPTDFSNASRKALHYAEKFAEQFHARIIVVYVVEPMPMPDFEAYPIALEHDALLAKTRQRLDQFARSYIRAEFLQKCVILTGKAYHEITEAALYLKVDLIIISTHGYTGLKHVMIGSTAERVVRHAPCPVLTVRDKESL